MNCFHHADRPAVAICRSCSVGLCRECGAEVGAGLACKGKCEDNARALVKLIDGNIRARSTSKGQLRQNLYFMLFIAAIGGLFGGLMINDGHFAPGVLFIAFGIGFALRSIAHYIRWARLAE